MNTTPNATGAGWEPIDHGFTCYGSGVRLTVTFEDNANEAGVELDAPTEYTGAILSEELRHEIRGFADMTERRISLEEAHEWLARDAADAVYQASFGLALCKAS
jgi:hypothetical protein